MSRAEFPCIFGASGSPIKTRPAPSSATSASSSPRVSLRRAFHLGGDPRLLKCCYCTVLDGYLARTSSRTPIFAHISCALFSPGGEIEDFGRMTPSAPGLHPQYNGLRMLNPRNVTPGVDDSYLRDYINMFPLFTLFSGRFAGVSWVASKALLTSPLFPMPETPANSAQNSVYSVRNTFNKLQPYYLENSREGQLVSLFRSVDCSRQKQNYSILEPQIPANLRSYGAHCGFCSETAGEPIEYNESRGIRRNGGLCADLAMPGGLCCYCRIPRGVTLRCGHPECCESFHFMCHWRNAGYCELRHTEIYIGGGKHPFLFALCLKHMPPQRRNSLCSEVLARYCMQCFSRGNPNTLREVLQRTEGQSGNAPNSVPNSVPNSIPNSAPNSALNSALNSAPVSAPISAPNSAPISAPISAPNSAPISAPVSAPVSAPISAPISARNSASEVCHVCGFGFYAPPINQEMVLEGSRFGRCVNIRRDRASATSASTSTSLPISSPAAATSFARTSESRESSNSIRRSMDHLMSTLLTAGEHMDCGSNVYLQPGTRGGMLRCVVCGTVVHEVCADLPRIQVLVQSDHIKCTLFGRFIFRLHVHSVSPGVRRSGAPNRRVLPRDPREDVSLRAFLLLGLRGQRGLLRADRRRGAGAQEMRPPAARIGVQHAPLPDDDRNQPDFQVAQRGGAHIGAVRAALHRLHGSAE